jgi:two-component system, cell cycle response regulator
MDLSKGNNSFYQKIMFLIFHKRKAKTNADNFFEITADPTVLLELIENSKTQVATINEKESSLSKTLLLFSIIDDDAMVRTLLVRILKLMEIDFTDIDIEEFEDGIQFLKSRRLEQSGEHFLILDGVMPAMDGI